ncbi:MAG TPA: MmcQ/YjbR family DNA-binding protein [Polyangia bacterium]|nr:MmcQ/YjbR family DNA-binding protein [Polyangia bacterium]
MATWDDIRAVALTLPGAWENEWYGQPSFQVGSKGFVQGFRGRTIMKLDRHHQELLFEARPDVFTPMIAGALRWSWVEIDALDADEIADLVREAWTCIVPKKVSRAYAAAREAL